MYSLRLPNKYNVSFDYYYFLIIAMLSYIPRKRDIFIRLVLFCHLPDLSTRDLQRVQIHVMKEQGGVRGHLAQKFRLRTLGDRTQNLSAGNTQATTLSSLFIPELLVI